MTSSGSARTTRWFRRYPAAGQPRARLVCLPHAGGAATFFHTWGGALGPGVEVLATRYPGRQERIAEPCATSMAELADPLAAELLPLLDVPVAFFGHSMGASLAYELALRLQPEHADRLAGLFVSSREAPHLVTPKEIHLGTDDELIAEVARLGGADAALLADPGIRDIVLPSVRADFRIAGTYRAAAPRPVGCPVVAYAGDRDPGAGENEMRHWSEVAGHSFDMRVLPGGHFYLNAERDSLTNDIRRRLDEAVLAPS
ncbi:thioesterase II family protein [Streptomyces yatensis]|uniref:Alpha/beta fold hydrolase n=1 Tax=Streptomyces yatensis TaxID=155177 RepID=A0ABN2JEX7_9ACTN|nr:thioesterase domain-containing protein [Streptomyces yatensis]